MHRIYWIGFSILTAGLLFWVWSPQDIQVIEAVNHGSGTAQTVDMNADERLSHIPDRLKSNMQITPLEKVSSLPIEKLENRSDKTELHQAIISENKQFKRYPPENVRFESSHQDPVSQRYAVDERSTANSDQTFGLTIWSNQKFYLQEDDVQIFAVVQNKDGQRIQTQIDAQLIFNNQTIAALQLEYINTDGLYTTNIRLSDITNTTPTPGIYKVLVHTPKENITDAITFTISQPDIQLTGEFKERINDEGHLEFQMEVQVERENNFYFQASLYSTTNTPVGTTQASHRLAKGKHWIPLTYAGLLIRDSGESGPYQLKQVSLAKVTMPMQRAPAIYPEFETAAYGLDEFSDAQFERP